uniref:(northern house mosquito) hypothetical protein n=2 Tax=Culex pipiens TaxID=7175 RepID=A0A8D8NMD4_CULPI
MRASRRIANLSCGNPDAGMYHEQQQQLLCSIFNLSDGNFHTGFEHRWISFQPKAPSGNAYFVPSTQVINLHQTVPPASRVGNGSSGQQSAEDDSSQNVKGAASGLSSECGISIFSRLGQPIFEVFENETLCAPFGSSGLRSADDYLSQNVADAASGQRSESGDSEFEFPADDQWDAEVNGGPRSV